MKNKDMKNKSSMAGFLHSLLGFIWWGLIVLTVILVFIPGARPVGTAASLQDNILTITTAAVILFAIFRLRQILASIINKNPFNRENVERFKQLGYLIFLVGVIDTVITFPAPGKTLLIGTPYGGITPEIFIYIILGFLALTLAEVFSQALQIKEENELTI